MVSAWKDQHKAPLYFQIKSKLQAALLKLQKLCAKHYRLKLTSFKRQYIKLFVRCFICVRTDKNRPKRKKKKSKIISIIKTFEHHRSFHSCWELPANFYFQEKKRRVLTVLTVPPHVLPWAFTGIVGNQVCANAPVLAWVPFTFINICKSQEKDTTKWKNKRCINLFREDVLLIRKGLSSLECNGSHHNIEFALCLLILSAYRSPHKDIAFLKLINCIAPQETINARTQAWVVRC